MIKLPAISGLIRRRILINYRVEPEVAAALLPGNFKPQLFNGHAIAGICLIRLEEVRPKGLPAFLGISSENSAHRIAVEWEDAAGAHREGVFVPRRDTDSRLNSIAGGRIFPGVHHHAEFHIQDQKGHISLTVFPPAAPPLVEVEAHETEHLPADSIFSSLGTASAFFETGCTGYSSRPGSCVMDGLLLKVADWRVSALSVTHLHSSYYEDHAIFPPGSIHFDHALLMRDIQHEWHSEPEMIAHQ